MPQARPGTVLVLARYLTPFPAYLVAAGLTLDRDSVIALVVAQGLTAVMFLVLTADGSGGFNCGFYLEIGG